VIVYYTLESEQHQIVHTSEQEPGKVFAPGDSDCCINGRYYMLGALPPAEDRQLVQVYDLPQPWIVGD
jgi:hypothetical protein